MDQINQSIVDGGLDNIHSKYTKISKHVGGKLVNTQYRIGGQTTYSIRDYDINHQLIVGSNDMLKSKKKKSKSSKKSKSPTKRSEILKLVKKPSLSERQSSICQEIGELYDIKGDIISSLKKIYHQSTENFVKHSVKVFKLEKVIINSLRYLHEAIVLQYLHIARLYIKSYPEKAVHMTKGTYLTNYTSDLIELLSIKFSDKKLATGLKKIQGFCPFEPWLRVKQLLDFPITNLVEKLNPTIIPLKIIPTNPKIERIENTPIESPSTSLSEVEQIIWYSKHIIDRWKSLRPIIEKREAVYVATAEQINQVANFLQSNLPS